MKIKFESKKGMLFSLVILGINFLLLSILISGFFNGGINKNELGGMIPVFGTVGLLFWLYFGTSYSLSEEEGLEYRSGPFRGKIGLHRITAIEKDKTLWAGFKPATSRKGLIIRYDRGGQLYISPRTNESFIDTILQLKPDIPIIQA